MMSISLKYIQLNHINDDDLGFYLSVLPNVKSDSSNQHFT